MIELSEAGKAWLNGRSMNELRNHVAKVLDLIDRLEVAPEPQSPEARLLLETTYTELANAALEAAAAAMGLLLRARRWRM